MVYRQTNGEFGMSEAEAVKVRIYCLCGQKMKVSGSMYGRPGKCVACRQKIRIPRRDEIPPDFKGVYEIYLKDHPEFLRKPQRREEPVEEPEEAQETAAEPEDVTLGEPEEEGEGLPLAVLEPLRVLCSFEHKVERRLYALRKDKTPLIEGLDKATLMSYRVMVRNARNALDDELRQRLHEVSEQLSWVVEQIARATLAVRIGEMAYDTFVKTVTPLRQRRERLELRRQNLRGWLGVSDPYMAGGYVEVSLEDVPIEGIEVTFPLDEKLGAPLVDLYVGYLRQALQARELAERKLVERQRMEKEGALSGASLEDCRADAEAERERARAAVAFYRTCLERIAQDCENDIKSARACLELAHSRLDAGELEPSAFQALEIALLRSQSDNAQARDLARRALSANTGSDVPRVQGTFLKRLAQRDVPTGIGLDSWIAWLAMTLMIVNIAVYISNAQDSGNIVVARGMVIGFFLTAALLAMIACIPRREIRGLLVSALWLVVCTAGTFHVQNVWHSLGPVGAAMRADPGWYLRPGILLFSVSALVMGISACVALAPFPRLRYVLVGVGAVSVAAMLGIATDAGGVLAAKCFMEEPESILSIEQPGLYDVRIAVSNRAFMGRSLWLGGAPIQVPNAATFLLERRIGSDSWNDVGAPFRLKRDDQPWADVTQPGAFPQLEIKAGQKVVLAYRLEPDTYRAQLIPAFGGYAPLVKSFTLVPPERTVETRRAPESAAPPIPESATGPEAQEGERAPQNVVHGAALVRAELRGVINAEGFAPSFSIILHFPDGRSAERNLTLGEQVYGPWKASEFSPAHKTLTLADGAHMLVFKPGESLDLEAAESEGAAPEGEPASPH